MIIAIDCFTKSRIRTVSKTVSFVEAAAIYVAVVNDAAVADTSVAVVAAVNAAAFVVVDVASVVAVNGAVVAVINVGVNTAAVVVVKNNAVAFVKYCCSCKCCCSCR